MAARNLTDQKISIGQQWPPKFVKLGWTIVYLCHPVIVPMAKSFSTLGFLSFCVFTLLKGNIEAKAQTRSEQSVSSQKTTEASLGKSTSNDKARDLNPVTYSKAGSDSISLIIFGRIMAPAVTANSPQNGTKTPTEAERKKEKFSIKSSDKLKTNNSLYWLNDKGLS